MTGPVLGVDIGKSGALAILTPAGDLLDVIRHARARGRASLTSERESAAAGRHHPPMGPAAAFVEYVGARPNDSRVGAFAFGRSRGAVEGVLGAAGIPTRFITAPVWKRAIGIPPGTGMKDAARSEAIRRWPAQAALFARKSDDGRAEAALIAVAGLIRHPSPAVAQKEIA